tara:strand:+ start:25266 stop:25496 length:231 start_codon:yes stop_codon:yes gene_type:complete
MIIKKLSDLDQDDGIMLIRGVGFRSSYYSAKDRPSLDSIPMSKISGGEYFRKTVSIRETHKGSGIWKIDEEFFYRG